MKNSLLPLLAALSLTVGAAQAQTPPPPSGPPPGAGRPLPSPDERAAREAEHLSKDLDLSADQRKRVQQLILGREQEMLARRAQARNADMTREQMDTQRRADHAKFEDQLKAVLTAEQYSKFMQNRGQHGPPGGPGGPGGPEGPGNPNQQVKKAKMKAK